MAKIIDERRYKKTTRKEIESHKKRRSTSRKTINYNQNNEESKKEKLDMSFDFYIKNNNKKSRKIPTFLKIFVLVGCIVAISFSSKKIVKIENMPIVNVFSNNDETVNLVSNYDFKIGLYSIDTTNENTTNNIILSEVLGTTYMRLLKINNDYTIEYEAIDKIQKIDDLNYKITLKLDCGIKVVDIMNSIQKIKNIGTQNPYYNLVENISDIQRIDSLNCNVKLTTANPYFPYTLIFPIYPESSEQKAMVGFNLISTTEQIVKILRNNTSSKLNTVTISNYIDANSMVNDFRNDKIDMFVASSDSIMQLIGKHDYSTKKYRDGETVFLFGNKNSIHFSKEEVRKAIAYSINREKLIKNVNPSFGEVIDIPYIYSPIQYKYDIYGADNVLLSNGWKKVGGVYTKNYDGENIQLEMNLILNEEDKIKVQIASNIKEMLEGMGIKLNVIPLNINDLNARLETGEYDLVLASVYVNESPDISQMYNYIDINEAVDNAIKNVNNSQVEDLCSNIQNLQNVISNQVACIGIMARNTNVVYQKYITGFEDTRYMNIFNEFKKIGKIAE